MSVYLDTSVIIAALTREPGSTAVQTALVALAPSSAAISHWTLTEVASALALKLRLRTISAAQHARARSTFQRRVQRSLVLRSVSAAHFAEAAKLADDPALNLRAADALHLAICLDSGDALFTLDRALAVAARAVGAEIHDLTP